MCIVSTTSSDGFHQTTKLEYNNVIIFVSHDDDNYAAINFQEKSQNTLSTCTTINSIKNGGCLYEGLFEVLTTQESIFPFIYPAHIMLPVMT